MIFHRRGTWLRMLTQRYRSRQLVKVPLNLPEHRTHLKDEPCPRSAKKKQNLSVQSLWGENCMELSIAKMTGLQIGKPRHHNSIPCGGQLILVLPKTIEFFKQIFESFRFLWPCIVSKLWSERENQQDATIRCLFSTISQHVSGIIMPIFRRTRRKLLHFTNFQKILLYQISWIFVQWKPRCSMRTYRWIDGRTDGQTNITNLIIACRKIANALKTQ